MRVLPPFCALQAIEDEDYDYASELGTLHAHTYQTTRTSHTRQHALHAALKSHPHHSTLSPTPYVRSSFLSTICVNSIKLESDAAGRGTLYTNKPPVTQNCLWFYKVRLRFVVDSIAQSGLLVRPVFILIMSFPPARILLTIPFLSLPLCPHTGRRGRNQGHHEASGGARPGGGGGGWGGGGGRSARR